MIRKIAITSFLFCVILMSPAFGQGKSSLTEDERREAIKDAFGLGCAVQDRDTERAFAWEGAAMGAAAAYQTKSSEVASEFTGVIYNTEKWARNGGGFNCKDFPKWPNQPAPQVP